MKVSLGQRRSQHAWHSVETLKKDPKASHYARNAKKLPMRIRTAGLGQALAFLLAKSKAEPKQQDLLHQQLSDWVLKKHGGIQGQAQDSLLQSLVQGDSLFLRRATAEAMAWLEWYNRFVEASGIKQEDE